MLGSYISFSSSSQTEAPSEQGLMALASLGLISSDHTLTNAALAEIEKHPQFSKNLFSNICFCMETFGLQL